MNLVFQGLVTLVWVALALSYCRCHGTTRPRGTLLQLFRLMSWIFAMHYGSKMIQGLDLGADSWLYLVSCVVSDVTIVGLLVVMRHLVPLGMLGEPRPSRAWLLTNYGLGLLGLVSLALPERAPVEAFDVFLTLLTGLILWEIVRFARTGGRQILMADLRFGGYLVLAAILFGGVLVIGLTESGSHDKTLGWIASHLGVGLLAAVPFALRVLGRVLSLLLRSALTFGLALGLFVTFKGVAAASGALGPRDFLAAVVLAAVLGPIANYLARTVDQSLLRLDHSWRQQLLASLRELSPEAGIRQTCQVAVSHLTRLVHVPGAGILLSDEDRPIQAGEIDLTPVIAVWPRADDIGGVPPGSFVLLWLDDSRLQAGLHEAGVSWVVEIVSPRHHWGYLFISAGVLNNAPSSARLESLEDFAHELALTLDAADLLVRARSAERDLGRSEKLAALGESAARIAHEIRNPVTAARSLAQLMAREPNSPLNQEHGELVVQELDRVEERVRSLLQFARQGEFSFEPLDLAVLVRETVKALESYPSTGDLEWRLQLQDGAWVAGDAERLRQVLVNLVTNGIDALAKHSGPRQLHLSVSRAGRFCELRVIDSGPGVVDELLPRLFEPFVTTKVTGTGLGLAIAKRIVDAHGGTITADPAATGGMAFTVRLPACDEGQQPCKPPVGASVVPFPDRSSSAESTDPVVRDAGVRDAEVLDAEVRGR